jgi:SWI/SNF-related matrix-associated actin-dependent regulator of chromatin subfamily A3
MGLGKTIVVISLVASTLEEARAWALEPIERDKTDSRFDSVAGAGSSDKKKVSLAEFSSRIYGLVDGGGSSLADAPSAPTSKKKQAKAKREKKREDANAARFGRLVTRSRATLIVCPLSTVQNWEAQFEEHTGYADGRAYLVKPKLELVEPVESPVKGKGKGKAKEKDKEKEKAEEKDEEVGEPRAISVYVYHGNSRIMDPVKLANYDVVITTFSTLGTEFSKQARAEEEREEEEEAAAAAALAASRDVSSDEGIEVFGYGPNGEIIESKPGQAVVEGGKGAKKAKRKRKKIEGSGVSPLQQIQWFRVVLDEAQ